MFSLLLSNTGSQMVRERVELRVTELEMRREMERERGGTREPDVQNDATNE